MDTYFETYFHYGLVDAFVNGMKRINIKIKNYQDN